MFEDRIGQRLQRHLGGHGAVVPRTAVVLDFLQHHDIGRVHRHTDVVGDRFEAAIGHVGVAVRIIDVEVEHIVGRDRQLVDRSLEHREFGQRVAGRSDGDHLGRQQFVIAETVADDAGHILEDRAGCHVGRIEDDTVEGRTSVDLDTFGVEIRTCAAVEFTEAACAAFDHDKSGFGDIGG